jgi:hypothetical protein
MLSLSKRATLQRPASSGGAVAPIGVDTSVRAAIMPEGGALVAA